MDIVECLVSMPAVRVFVGSTLVTISFDLANRDYIYDRMFYMYFFKNLGLRQ